MVRARNKESSRCLVVQRSAAECRVSVARELGVCPDGETRLGEVRGALRGLCAPRRDS